MAGSLRYASTAARADRVRIIERIPSEAFVTQTDGVFMKSNSVAGEVSRKVPASAGRRSGRAIRKTGDIFNFKTGEEQRNRFGQPVVGRTARKNGADHDARES